MHYASANAAQNLSFYCNAYNSIFTIKWETTWSIIILITCIFYVGAWWLDNTINSVVVRVDYNLGMHLMCNAECCGTRTSMTWLDFMILDPLHQSSLR